MSRRTTDRVFESGETILGKYKVLRVAGVGGMGAVLEAENLRTSRKVAIKVLSAVDEAKASTATRRFVNEARAAAKITHPNSVDVLDLDQDEEGALYIVQEFLEGESLFERVSRERRIPWRESLELMLPVMSALAEAHRKGIVHRDVKPENVFLTEAAPGVVVPKIIDFGIARLAESDLRLTRNDRVMGTPYYMSPEQASGERELSGQTDVWAVGVVLYEMITGTLPFDGQNLEVVMRNIVGGLFTPMRLRDPELPAELTAVIERALKRDRAVRYATMQEFLDAAIPCLGETPVGVGRLHRSAQAPVPPIAPIVPDEGPSSLVPHTTISAERARPGLRVTPMGALALISVLTLGFASGALVSFRMRPAPPVAVVAPPPRVVASPPRECVPAPVPTPPAPVVAAPIATAPDASVVAPETPRRRVRVRTRVGQRPRR
jgi:serine/threonine-protein kinase